MLVRLTCGTVPVRLTGRRARLALPRWNPTIGAAYPGTHVRNRGIRRSPGRARRRPGRAAAARVPRLRLGGRRGPQRRRALWPSNARPGGWRTWRRSLDEVGPRPLRGHRPASATPAGRRTARRPTATRTRTATRPPDVAVVHNGIIENFVPLRAELEAPRRRADVATPTPRPPRTSSRWPTPADRDETKGDLPASVRAVARRLEGAFTLVFTHADEPDQDRRRPPQLAAGGRASARARRSSPPTSPRSSSTPATRSSWARTRSS